MIEKLTSRQVICFGIKAACYSYTNQTRGQILQRDNIRYEIGERFLLDRSSILWNIPSGKHRPLL